MRAAPKCVDEVTPRPICIAGDKVGRGQRAANAHRFPFLLWVNLKAAALSNYGVEYGGFKEGGQTGFFEVGREMMRVPAIRRCGKDAIEFQSG